MIFQGISNNCLTQDRCSPYISPPPPPPPPVFKLSRVEADEKMLTNEYKPCVYSRGFTVSNPNQVCYSSVVAMV